MIVKMKKVTLLLSRKERKSGLERLRKLGLLHVKNLQNPQSDEIDDLQAKIEAIGRVVGVLGRAESGVKRIDEKRADEVVDRVNRLLHDNEKLVKELERLRNIHTWYEMFGRVSLEEIDRLRNEGIYLKFYSCDRSSIKKIDDRKQIYIVGRERGIFYVVLITTDPQDGLKFTEYPLPDIECSELEKRIGEIEKKISSTKTTLKKLGRYRDSLNKHRSYLEKRLAFYRVLHGMAQEEGFVYIQGFCPVDNLSELKECAEHQGWAYVIQDPDDPSEVPTLIKTHRWLKIINPVFKFMDTLPGYNEYDISFWFLLFFSIFFAILIGDAGYGMLFIIFSFIASRKFRAVPREPFVLLYVLGGTTVLWGAISGTWFGFEGIAHVPFLSSIIVDRVNSFAEENTLFMMYLCFIIGVVHLSIAHGIRMVNMINSLKALSELGWILILWSLFFVAGKLVLDRPVPFLTLPLLILGCFLTLTFTNYQKNILKGALATLGDLPLSVIGSFSDLVSYLRLFAVGYASVIVASSFNEMAIGDGIHSVLHGLMAALILFFGHTLNIILGLLAVIVHGIRLNMLEFSGQLNMQWSGRPYKPFRDV